MNGHGEELFDFVRELEVEVCHGRIGTIFNRDKHKSVKNPKNEMKIILSVKVHNK